ncbi:MAG: aconitase X catalytic domain-containing protein [Candidatus Altiarchaeota archaeon]
MHLTKREKDMLNGRYGTTKKKAMEILVSLGKIFNAKSMIKIASAQISGISYKNLSDEGLGFLNDFLAEDVKVEVPTTINPCGMDLKQWQEMGIQKKFAKKQLEIIKIFKKINASITCSCVPYLIGNKPKFHEHIAWAESSAVIYANSVLGAYSNRESGISALCSAITGVTPKYGYHLDEKRKANYLVNVKVKLKNDSDFSALGYLIGKKILNGVPYIQGIKKVTKKNLKFLGASMASSGGISLYHIKGITPEARKYNMLSKKFEKVEITDLSEAYEELNFDSGEVDLIAIGCPHTSLYELKKIAKLLNGRKAKTKIWIMTSRKIKEIAEKKSLIKKIEGSGAKIFADTCMVVSPLKKKFKRIATNSGKAAFYLRSYCNAKVNFGSLEKCINAALKGEWN